MQALISGPTMVVLGRRWSSRPFNAQLLSYYVENSILPKPVVQGGPSVASFFDWKALITLRLVIELRKRALPFDPYRKGIDLILKRFPKLLERASISFVTDGRELVVLEHKRDHARAWDLVSRSGNATGAAIAVPVRIDLDLAAMKHDVAREIAAYDQKRAGVRERARARADELRKARKRAARKRKRAAA